MFFIDYLLIILMIIDVFWKFNKVVLVGIKLVLLEVLYFIGKDRNKMMYF